MATGATAYERHSRALNRAVWLLGFWIALVSLFFLLQAMDYRGLVAQLAEWQFLQFNQYWPTLTFIVMTVLFASPLIAAVLLLRLRQKKDEALGPVPIDPGRIMRGRLARLQGLFSGLAAGSLLAAVIVLVMSLQLPSDEGSPRSIVLGTPDAIAPVEGRAILTGEVRLDQTAQFNENLLLVKRTLYFAPVRIGPDDREPLRYFVEVRRNDVDAPYDEIRFPRQNKPVKVWRFQVAENAFTPYMNGLLRRRALPGEIANLYRYAGYQVDADNYVLFRSLARLNWRYYVLAAQFAIAALITGLAALLFARRKRVVTQRMREEALMPPVSAAAAV